MEYKKERNLKILLTAFCRTSAELLLKGMVQYKILFLPNDKEKDSQLLLEALSGDSFDFVISFGQRPNIKDKVHIETTARKGGGSIGTAFACEELKQVFEQNGLVSKISHNAGTSFCNELYWNGLQYISQNKLNTKMVFVHVPFAKNIVDIEVFREKMLKGLEEFCDADVSELTEAELNAELEKGYADMLAGRTKPVRQAFADIRRDYGL